ncbi:MAG: helix-turn-helix domain-containing protein [Treponema sp.]|nr:helix-turn-helix domain-containing protein [Treponema sp.]
MNDDVFDYRSLSVYLKLSPNTLRHKVSKGAIPFVKIDGAVRFYKKKIDEWLEGLHRGTKNKTPDKKSDLFSADKSEGEK